jgi:S-(hydroxymethyl)glutathione dehydrogenase/alcohol dehydrogenase
MKAAVLYERRAKMLIEEVELKSPAANEVRIKIKAAGVCHSDYHHWEHEYGSVLPMVLGHEVAGVVDAVGGGVSRVHLGDRAVVAFGYRCGECFYCRKGEPYLCTPPADSPLLKRFPRIWKGKQGINSFSATGGFAEYTVFPETNVIPLPDDVPFEVGALVGCAVATGFGAVVNTARVQPGSTVVVIGCGGVGLNVIQTAAVVGAAKIIAVDIRDDKLTYAKQFGATHVINASHEDTVGRVRALTGGFGVDYAFEVISHPKTIEQAYESLRKGGVAVVVGISPLDTRISIDPLAMMRTGRTIMGSALGNIRPAIDFPRIFELYQAGKLHLREMVSRTFTLSEINEAFSALGAGDVVRGVVVFD